MFPEVQAGGGGELGVEGDGKQVRIPGPDHTRPGKVGENRQGSQGLEVKLPPLPQRRGQSQVTPGSWGSWKE